jgi:hypothetical protein
MDIDPRVLNLIGDVRATIPPVDHLLVLHAADCKERFCTEFRKLIAHEQAGRDWAHRERELGPVPALRQLTKCPRSNRTLVRS